MIPNEARGAWREIEARVRPYVARRVAAPADVDDIVQEVFLRLHRGISGLEDEESFGGWVYRIAERAVLDHLRQRARHPLTPAHELEEQGDAPSEVPEAHDLQSQLAECVALFVARLPSPYREAVTLTELQGLTQKDAAEMLGLSLSGMKSRVQRGRAQILRMFEQCCEVSVDARGHVLECSPRSLAEIPEDCRAAALSWASRRQSGC
jgi:RNA polymerase sigma-70 factor (ECF subfamily)